MFSQNVFYCTYFELHQSIHQETNVYIILFIRQSTTHYDTVAHW